MGIKDFFKVVTHVENKKEITIGDLGKEVKISDLKGKRICIDASYVIYNSLLALTHVKALADKEGNPTGHINTVMQKVLMYKKHGIEQIWIFDNKEPNILKKQELERRATRRAKAKDPRAKFVMTSKHVEDIITLLTLMGIPYIVTEPRIEAEQYGAFLTVTGQNKFCDMMLSGDSDVLIFGGTLLRPVTKKSASGKTKKTIYLLYELDTIIHETDLSWEQLAELAVVMGSDFAPKTSGIGPKTVIKRIKKGVNLTPEQTEAKQYFLNDVEVKIDDLITPVYNKDILVQFLVGKNFNQERIEKRLEILNQN